MKTKVLYVLVSQESDIYLEQAFISISSLRHCMGKDVNINVLTDTITYGGLDENRMKMLKDVDNIIQVDLPASFSAQNRSRILKTSCREHIEGDFLFIDCDTIILKSLAEADTFTEEIRACYDSHTTLPSNPYKEMCIEHCAKLGINIENETKYYNSGVIYVKDSLKARKFFKEWYSNWLAGREKGVNMDQPAFNKTNIQSGYLIKTLPDEWNCEFIHGIRFLNKAKILHYLCTNVSKKKNQEAYILRDAEIFKQIKETQQIPEEILKCFDDPFVGIPPLTTIVAGDHNYVLRTPIYKYLYTHFNTPNYNRITKFLLGVNRLKNLFHSK